MIRPACLFARLLACLLLSTLPPSPALALHVEIGKPIPAVVLPNLDGESVSLSGLRGKIVILSFWASWCPRCVEELTFLQGISKTSPDIVVVAINQESQNVSKAHIERIKRTLKDWRVDFPVLIDRDLEAWNAFRMEALPASVILDKQGLVRYAEKMSCWAAQDKVAEVIQAIRLGK